VSQIRVPQSPSVYQEKKMKKLVARFVNETEGQDLIEYALLAALIALAVTVGMKNLATGINTEFNNLSTQVTTAS
jgi:pilus assembly protein Flp/PilA